MYINKLTSLKTHVFLLSIYLFILELTVLRLTPSYVRYLGYFNNFILLAIFFGFGLGFALTKSKINLVRFHFPILLLYLAAIFSAKAEIQISGGDIIFFQSNKGPIPLPSFLLLPIFFMLVSSIFITATQKLGKSFTKLPSLTAYQFNIAGSLFGIIVFSLVSFFSLPPLIWFGISSGIWLLSFLVDENKHKIGIIYDFVYIGLSLILVGLFTSNSLWSPYQRIDINQTGKNYLLRVNGISHQIVSPVEDNLNSFYQLPYNFLHKNIRNVLIIGAGAGNDVSVAIHNGVEKITAVEIDPQILDIGKKLHPSFPYQNPSVTTIVGDGRNAMKRLPEGSYDLIIYALPDSLALSSGFSNLRLEGYLFTTEAFFDAKRLLTHDGVFVLYNNYRLEWLVDRIGSMLNLVFDSPPVVFVNSGKKYYNAVFLTGPGIDKSQQVTSIFDLQSYLPKKDSVLPSDDWPFLYLRNRSVPFIYLGALSIIIILSTVMIYLTYWRNSNRIFPLTFFFFGVAFMLLETRSLANFALLFGSTWWVNSLVFFAILVSIYFAISLVESKKIQTLKIFWVFLFLSLGINALFSEQFLLIPNLIVRYFVSSIFFFSPIFFANIIFSFLFRSEKNGYAALGSNLLGAMVGGILEYASLLFGYKFIIVMAICIYFFALVTNQKISVTRKLHIR